MQFKKVLVVDDSRAMIITIQNSLKDAGFLNIVTAFNGMDALEKLAKERDIDLILCDWNMPKMSGLDFLKAVKSNSVTSGIPFIMVTARMVQKDVIEAAKAGVNDYLVKPFDAKKALEKINRLAEKQG